MRQRNDINSSFIAETVEYFPDNGGHLGVLLRDIENIKTTGVIGETETSKDRYPAYRKRLNFMITLAFEEERLLRGRFRLYRDMVDAASGRPLCP